MSLNDDNTRAVVAGHAGQRIALTVMFFRQPPSTATWDQFPHGSEEAWLELLKTDLVALAGQVQERINQITVSTPEDFG